MSTYNWKINADNHAADWYYESIAEDSAVAGELGDTFIQQTQSAGESDLSTVDLTEQTSCVFFNPQLDTLDFFESSSPNEVPPPLLPDFPLPPLLHCSRRPADAHDSNDGLRRQRRP